MPAIRRFTARHALLLMPLLLAAFFTPAGNPPAFAAERSQRPKAEAPPPPAVLSIIPAQAEPGNRVTIFGTAFGDRISAFLGSVEIPARVTGGKQVEFTVPQLDAGLYALYLRRADGATGRPYNFTILPLRPVLNELSPPKIDSCAQGRDREITALGGHFIENSMLLFDGAVIKSRVLTP
ncbi:MAG TPA: IPT/TIG domain-containing protein, partial [Desulfuromonadaceae bacterium]